MMQEIVYKDTLIGIHITGALPEGSVPHTAPEESLGLLTLKYPKGTHLKAHQHAPKERSTQQLQECFVVRKGRVQISLYGADKKHFKTIELGPGEAFIALSGGHAFDFLEDAELIELKNGPYVEDKEFIEI